MTAMPLHVTVNGEEHELSVEPRRLLVDVLRQQLGLTGTHVGCEQGACGACTVIVDGAAVRSCTMLALSAHGCDIRTVEGLTGPGRDVHPVQRAFRDNHALQCGFCTPGMLMLVTSVLDELPTMTDEQIRELLAGQLCRCTGYEPVVAAVREAGRAIGGRPE
jgi:carbon-monoxide dehydrogenase small subunit